MEPQAPQPVGPALELGRIIKDPTWLRLSVRIVEEKVSMTTAQDAAWEACDWPYVCGTIQVI